MNVLKSWWRRTAVLVAAIAAVLASTFVAAAPSLAWTNITSLGNGGVLTYNGNLLVNTGTVKWEFFLDSTGHAILYRYSDGFHCASWPAPSTAAPGTSSTRRAVYVSGTQQILLQNNGQTYFTLSGNTALGGNTVNINSSGTLYIGQTPIHGC